MAQPPPLDYEPALHKASRLRKVRSVIWVVLATFIAIAAGVLILMMLPPERHTAYRAKCSSNLQCIGLSCTLYANDFGHVFPDSLATLMTTKDLSTDWLICPLSTDKRPTGATPTQQAANLAVPGYCSYVYVGASLTDQSSANCVVAWEDPANHEMEGANVLYADATVVFEPLTTVVQLVPELEAGHNPPTIAKLSQKQAEALYAKSWKPKLTAMKTGVWAAGLPRPTTRPASADE